MSFEISIRTPLPEALLEILELPSEAKADGRSEHLARLARLREAAEPAAPPAAGALAAQAPVSGRVGFCRQLLILTQRTLLNVKRTKALTVVRAVQTVMSAILISWVFVQLKFDLSGVRERMFAAFLVCFAQFLFSTLSVVNTFPSERAVFLREAQDRWYHPTAFYLSKVVVDTLMQALFPILATVVAYWFIGLNSTSASRVLLFYTTLMLMSNTGASVGFMISASVGSVTTALAITPATILPQILLCGLFKPCITLPQPFHTISYIAAARYALQSVLANEFTCESQDSNCPASARFLHGGACSGSPCRYCCTDSDVISTKGVCPVVTCDDALQFLGQSSENIWPSGNTTEETIAYNLIALCVLMLIFRFLGLVALLAAYRRASKSG